MGLGSKLRLRHGHLGAKRIHGSLVPQLSKGGRFRVLEPGCVCSVRMCDSIKLCSVGQPLRLLRRAAG